MPQVKELKELKLLVSNEKTNGRYGGVLRGDLMTVAAPAVFYSVSLPSHRMRQ
jgi:hypothetical protein